MGEMVSIIIRRDEPGLGRKVSRGSLEAGL